MKIQDMFAAYGDRQLGFITCDDRFGCHYIL